MHAEDRLIGPEDDLSCRRLTWYRGTLDSWSRSKLMRRALSTDSRPRRKPPPIKKLVHGMVKNFVPTCATITWSDCCRLAVLQCWGLQVEACA